MSRKYWLMKVEPSAYSIDDFEQERETGWEGVRNYQARNFMRDEMQVGDGVLFYQSNANPSGVAGVAEIARAGYPDPMQFERGHPYHDPESRKDDPRWYQVDIRFVERFWAAVPLADLKANPALEGMMVTKRGARLSVQPVDKAHFEEVVRMGRSSG